MTRKKMQFYEFRADEAIEITNEIRENRKEIIDDAVQSFADKIAQQARKTPLQWYNYYEFWD
jgi:predicted LPLAT superfamily acyltransferase